jgi:chorismate mutase
MRRRRETRQKVLRLKSTSADGSGMAMRAMLLPPVKVPVFDPAREQAVENDRAADVDLVVFIPGERAIRVVGQKEIVWGGGRR